MLLETRGTTSCGIFENRSYYIFQRYISLYKKEKKMAKFYSSQITMAECQMFDEKNSLESPQHNNNNTGQSQ